MIFYLDIKYLDFLPIEVRVGPWKKIATPMHLAMWLSLYLTRPSFNDISNMVDENSHSIFSTWWYHNLIVATLTAAIWCESWMNTPYSKFSFTAQSFYVLTLRSIVAVLLPIFPSLHVINECMRFVCLSMAVFTSGIATFILIPMRYFYYKTQNERKQYLKANLTYHMISFHQLNAVYAILNTMYCQSEPFTITHLWFGYLAFFSYSAFYLCVMDRLGFHLYPFLSPRRLLILVTWPMSCCVPYVFYVIANKFLE